MRRSRRMSQYVYRFGGGISDGKAGDRNLLGGKGANLAEMASIGLRVPPGFTISTEMCAVYYAQGEAFPDSLREEVATGLAHIEGLTGKRFGDAADPLLVSVRSGARVSMPGMMDTVLNLGLNDSTVEGLAAVSGDPRFAWDSYRRFIQMYSDVVLGIRTPQYLTRAAREAAGAKAASMEESMPEVFAELARVFDLLEAHYRDMQDIEFTVERGALFMLQTRSGKRTAKAALRIAVAMAEDRLISEEEAVLRIDPQALDQLLHPTLDPKPERHVIARRLPAS